jgi:protein ImuB
LARLEALLGEDRVGTPDPQRVHQPDVFVMRPFQDVAEAAVVPNRRKKKRKLLPLEEALQSQTSRIQLGLPLRRFRPPTAISVATDQERPIAILAGPIQGPLCDQRGPWLLSGEWWQKEHWACKEWDVRLEDGSLYRLAEVKRHQWVLAGVYG